MYSFSTSIQCYTCNRHSVKESTRCSEIMWANRYWQKWKLYMQSNLLVVVFISSPVKTSRNFANTQSWLIWISLCKKTTNNSTQIKPLKLTPKLHWAIWWCRGWQCHFEAHSSWGQTLFGHRFSEFACSLGVCAGFLQVLRFSFTVQKLAFKGQLATRNCLYVWMWVWMSVCLSLC